jgi:hypothetical protein
MTGLWAAGAGVSIPRTYASWLIQMEIRLNLLTQRAILPGAFHSLSDRAAKMNGLVQHHNLGAEPPGWLAPTDSALARLERQGQVFSGTGHEFMLRYCPFPVGSNWQVPDRVGGAGRPPLLSHHRTCGAASGGSPGNMQLVINRGEAQLTLRLPIGIAQGHMNHRCRRHVPWTLADGSQGGQVSRDTQRDQLPPACYSPLPSFPEELPQPSAKPLIQFGNHTRGISQPEVPHPASQIHIELPDDFLQSA